MNTFVAIDLETTGLDTRRDEIIEIGAVRVEDGRVVGTFEQLVRPTLDLPLSTQRVTGIVPSDLEGKPDGRTALAALMAFAGDLPLVAHNAGFDGTFLRRESGGRIGLQMLDSLELARIVMPTLARHDLASLKEHFGLTESEKHRALSDAQLAADVWLKLIEGLYRLPLAVLSELVWIVDRTQSPLRPVLAAAESAARAAHPVGREPITAILQDFEDQVGKRAPKRPAEPKHTLLEVDAIVHPLESDGALQGALNGYENRPEQIQMAREVAEAIGTEKILMVEAGTGTGKSMAYLTPAVMWAQQNKERVVVSTNTKNLQDQLLTKDIPLLEQVLGRPIRTALAKGRSNYLCVLKLFGYLRDLRNEELDDRVLSFLPILSWAQQTDTGDISENASFLIYRSREMWDRLYSAGDDCGGRNCTYYNNCFLMKARQAVQEAELIVANHSVVFSDIATDNALLPDYAYLIFDEAHNIENVATEHMRREVNKQRILRILARLYRPSKQVRGSGLLPQVMDEVEGLAAPPDWKDAIARLAEDGIDRAKRLTSIADQFEGTLAELFGRSDKETRLRYRAEGRTHPVWESIESIARAIIADAGAMATGIDSIVERLTDLDKGLLPFRNELAKDLEGQAELLRQVGQDAEVLLLAAGDDSVYWAERHRGGGRWRAHSLCAAPLEVARMMKEQLYDKKASIIMTSATLTVKGTFDFLLGRLGLDALEEGRVQTATMGSSFDYATQTRVVLPNFLPPPTESPAFEQELADLLIDVHRITRGRGLVLFTAYGMLKKVRARVKPALEAEGILVLAQGVDGSRRMITETFRTDTSSVLLATSSFWEGVDIVGESLSCLTLVRLPFQVVGDPVIDARCEHLQQQGLEPFRRYSVPNAVIRFRQGFGRLIRARTDRGLVILADKRLRTKAYGSSFLGSLPTETEVHGKSAPFLQSIEAFFAQEAGKEAE